MEAVADEGSESAGTGDRGMEIDMKEYGFIGVGNMAGAMIGGMLQSKRADSSQIIGSCKSAASRENKEALYHIAMTGDNREVAKEAGILFLCVKPQFLDGVIDEI